MPTAELLKPRRLRKYGRIWEQGIQYPISVKDAETLEEDDRFKVKAFGKAAKIAPAEDMIKVPDSVDDLHEDGKPKHHGRLMEAIVEANDALEDDEEAFETNGLPKVEALGAKLGYVITAQERDQAMGVKKVERQQNEARAHASMAERGDLKSLRPSRAEKGTGEKGLSAGAKIRLKKKDAPLDTGAKRAAQAAAEAEDADPSKEGATEV